MKSRTILVIEDNDMNMKLMRAVLRLGNYEVLEAMDAETGIELARKRPPDLILMDLQLPGLDGLSATRILKADPLLKEIPVYAVTGFAMEAEKQKARGIGFAGYIVKPFGVQQLLGTLARQLAGTSPNAWGAE